MGRPQPNTDYFREREKNRDRPRGLYMEAKTLNQWRRLRGLEVDQLAELTGVGTSIESYLYRGANPRVELALKFARVLGLDVQQIIWGRPEKADPASLPPMPQSLPFDPRAGTPIISDEQMKIAVQWAEGGYNKQEIYQAMGVSRQTFYKALAKYEAVHGPVMFSRGRPTPATAAAAVKAAKKRTAKG